MDLTHSSNRHRDHLLYHEGVIGLSKLGKVRFNRKCERYFVDLTWHGKRYHLYKYLGCVPCRDEAMAVQLLHDVRSEVNKGIFNPERYKRRRPLHLAQYAETWLRWIQVSEATYHDYENSLRNHILPHLGNEFLPDINYDKLRKLQTSIKRSPKGKYNVMGCLRKLLRDAYRSGHIPIMPEFPGFKGSEAVVPPPISWIEDADQWKILEEIPLEDRYVFIFMKLTGCRPSEARAFRWQDIRKDHIVFHITFGRGETLKEVKGKKVRTFPRTEALEQLFREIPRNLTPFVFLYSKTGKPYTKNFNRIWNTACDSAGVQRVPLYPSTRHSFACQLLNAGLDKAIVQRLLGHQDGRMTDRYAEYSTTSLKIALDRVIKLPVVNNMETRETEGRISQ
jgi:integrase